MFVVPDEAELMIERGAADPTGGSLRRRIRRACLSCPLTWNGLSNGVQRTRQARPSDLHIRERPAI